jgi:hypothetical protein
MCDKCYNREPSRSQRASGTETMPSGGYKPDFLRCYMRGTHRYGAIFLMAETAEFLVCGLWSRSSFLSGASLETHLARVRRCCELPGLSLISPITRSMFVIWNLRWVSTRKYTTGSPCSMLWRRTLKRGNLPSARLGQRIQAIPNSRTKAAAAVVNGQGVSFGRVKRSRNCAQNYDPTLVGRKWFAG